MNITNEGEEEKTDIQCEPLEFGPFYWALDLPMRLVSKAEHDAQLQERENEKRLT